MKGFMFSKRVYEKSQLKDALSLASMVRNSGAKGMTIGRNIWGFPHVTEALVAFKAVVHEGLNPEQAMKKAGILE
ncbi:MAG: hypothetical protein QGG64_09585 [Candidatus Latescibacteria bacterium]|nr:hypothetical protein [Candidatus Latescibacterota bacterium]